jgi:DNA-3-methyladenine glycosylase I
MNENTYQAPVNRCPWVDMAKPDYVAYHDIEWGVPVHEDHRIFEFIILESMQAGLSWYTVLRKREHFRAAFKGFDPEKVARFDEKRMASLLENPGIIRNRRKIAAAVLNARKFLDIQEAFGTFDAYIWRFVDGRPIINTIYKDSEYPCQSPESISLSKDLRKRGFQFMGPTVCYSHMQATGMVNDHTMDCFRRAEIINL